MFPLKMKTISPRGFSPMECFRIGCSKKCTNGLIKKSAKGVKILIQGPIHKAPDSFLVGFSEIINITLPVPPTPCHSVRSRRRSRRIHHPTNHPRPQREWGPLQTLVEGRARAISPKLLIAVTGTERQGEGFPSLFEM